MSLDPIYQRVNTLSEISEEINKDIKLKKKLDPIITNKIIKLNKKILKFQSDLSELPKEKQTTYLKAAKLCEELQQQSAKLLESFNRTIQINEDDIKIIPFYSEFQVEAKKPSLKESFVKTLKPKTIDRFFLGKAAAEELKSEESALKKLTQKVQKLTLKKEKLSKKMGGDIDIDVKGRIKLTEIDDKLKQLDSKIAKKTKALADLSESRKKGMEARQLLEAAGGERVILGTSDGVQIDGMFLSTQKFREKLKKDGGLAVRITKTLADKTQYEMNGLAFERKDYEKNPEHILHKLHKLHVFQHFNPPSSGAGWSLVIERDVVFVFPDDYLIPLQNNQDTKQHFFYRDSKNNPRLARENKDENIRIDYFEIDTAPSKGGVVIKTTGKGDVYERRKSELMAFLLMGMDVMAFNFRGTGESHGTPSAVGFERDLETVYKYTKEKTKLPDSMFVFVALCLSGGIASKVTSDHPHANIFIGQSYSHFSKLAKDQAQKEVEYKVKTSKSLKLGKKAVKHLLTPVVQEAASLVAPDLSVARYLKDIKGQKAFFLIQDDQMMSLDHFEENMKALKRKGGLENVSVYTAPGRHGDSWHSITSSRFAYSDLSKEIQKIKARSESEIKKLYEIYSANNRKLQEKLSHANEQIKAANDGKKPLPLDPGGPVLNLEEMNAYAQTLKETKDKIAQQYNRQIAEINSEDARQINSLPEKLQESDTQLSSVGRNQMLHFLRKCGLSDPIIGSIEGQKIQKNPIMQELAEWTDHILKNIDESDKMIKQFWVLKSSPISGMEINEHQHVFLLDGNGQGRGYRLEVSPKEILSLQLKYKEMDKFKEIYKAWKERTADEQFDEKVKQLELDLHQIMEAIRQGYIQNNEKVSQECACEIDLLSKLLSKTLLDGLKKVEQLDTIIHSAEQTGNKEALKEKVNAQLRKLAKTFKQISLHNQSVDELQRKIAERIDKHTTYFPEERGSFFDAKLMELKQKLAIAEASLKNRTGELTFEHDQMSASWLDSFINWIYS